MQRTVYKPSAREPPQKIQKTSPKTSFEASRLSLYTSPPSADASIELFEFEKFAYDRIRVLDKIEDVKLGKNISDIAKLCRPLLTSCLPLEQTASQQVSEAQVYKDQLSHFILRIAFCGDKMSRERFVSLESVLFGIRLEVENLDAKMKFIKANNISLPAASPEEMEKLDLQGVYFKVPFERGLKYLANHSAVVHEGYVYLESKCLDYLLTQCFTEKLSEEMVILARKKALFAQDERLQPVLSLKSSMIRPGSSEVDLSKIGSSDLRSEDIEGLDKQNYMPLCSSVLYTELRRTRHHFYHERVQFIHFLRDIGLKLEETKKLYESLYDKQKDWQAPLSFAEHRYGKTGSRIKYSRLTCQSVCNDKGESGQVHGCPYKLFSAERLSELIKQRGGTDDKKIKEITDLAAETRYNLACTKTYELLHSDDKTIYPQSIMYPSEYYERAVAHAEQKKKDAEDQSQK